MSTQRCHQALVRAGEGLAVMPVPTPCLEEGMVLVAPSYVGVCGTDLQILNGSRPDTAGILGHEAAGVVVEAGPGAALRAGERVVFNPSAQLTRGRILGHNTPGLFQQYFAVDRQAIDDGLVQRTEEGLPDVCGALVEPVGGVIYAHDLISNVVSDLRSVVVFGAGPIGLITCEYFASKGARVALVHSSQKRLDSVTGCGLLDPGSTMVFSDDLAARILAWNGGQPLDAAVICTSMAGAFAALSCAVEVLRSGACVEMVTNYPASSPTPPGISAADLRVVRAANICGEPRYGVYFDGTISGRQISFTSHRGTSRSHLSQAMQVLSAKGQRYTQLITHRLSMQEAAPAIEILARTRNASIEGKDCIKAVIDLTLTNGAD